MRSLSVANEMLRGKIQPTTARQVVVLIRLVQSGLWERAADTAAVLEFEFPEEAAGLERAVGLDRQDAELGPDGGHDGFSFPIA